MVTPAYLIEIGEQQSVSEFVKHILYTKFNVHRFNEESNDLTSSMSKNLLDQVTPIKFRNYSIEIFRAELEKEIDVNEQAQIEK